MTDSPEPNVDRGEWRLLPWERVLWHGRPVPGAPREGLWLVAPALAFGVAAVAGLFAALVFVADLPGARDLMLVTAYMSAFAGALLLFPRVLLAGVEYLVTDRRVLWRRGRLQRAMDRPAVTFGRIRWHRSLAGVGTLELVRALPFGPLARQQRLVLSDVARPDQVLAVVRGAAPSPQGGDGQVPLIERLGPEERVMWGGRPEGRFLGWREMATALLGVAVLGIGMFRGHRLLQVIIGLEDAGMKVGSREWFLLMAASVLGWAMTVAVGAGLVWYGVIRARRLGLATDYLLTDRRLLIRRGRTELSLDRARIVDVADVPLSGARHHLFLVLDAPESRALSVSGALGPILPPRDRVPPVLFSLCDAERVKALILDRAGRSHRAPLPDAA